MSRKLILPSLFIALAVLACSVEFNLTEPPPSATEPPLPPEGITPVEPYLPPPVSDLTLDALRNATYDVSEFFGSPHSVTLVNGSYASGPDPAVIDYISVYMSDMVAFGDLNYDGANDAAVILGINTGGTGVFTYIAAVLNVGGSPMHVASVFIDDRPMVTGLVINAGEILAQTTIHGPDDPGCCPNSPVEQGWRLYNGSQLVLSRWAGQTSGGTPRTIDIDSPLDLVVVAYPFTVSGGVSIGPFENTLGYSIYAPDNTLVTSGSVMTDSPDAGLPGNFSLLVDLSMAGVTGLVRIEFVEFSMADGSIVTLDSVLVKVP
jgi:hypothetical protein